MTENRTKDKQLTPDAAVRKEMEACGVAEALKKRYPPSKEPLALERQREADRETLRKMVDDLAEIIERVEREGNRTGGLESARREIDWAAGTVL